MSTILESIFIELVPSTYVNVQNSINYHLFYQLLDISNERLSWNTLYILNCFLVITTEIFYRKINKPSHPHYDFLGQIRWLKFHVAALQGWLLHFINIYIKRNWSFTKTINDKMRVNVYSILYLWYKKMIHLLRKTIE